ncbi:dTDP-4-dehydrorhamnose reductase [Ascidiaceihabitans sp.]|nr:dTDP-4-dehydrorhamnose reductase [Ascidiaceihabitans sp.]MDA9136375.1 dTDP-4-dehydrorhamnose reductase [Ascidiaceihabitans sp.]
MKILVFGKTGQVARELQRQADVVALDRSQADLSDPAACAAIVRHSDANVIINAAAYTAVDQAETNEGLATTINAVAPTEMAKAAAARGLPFLHVSTDYVFDGSGSAPRFPEEPTAPINAYGRSKLAGEQGVVAAGGTYAILRTSWVFSAHGANFVKSMLRLGKERSALSIVDDQIGGPTPAADIVATLLQMANQLCPDNSGIYHYAGAPEVSWKDFATEIFRQASLPVEVSGILTADYPSPAARPLNSRLDCSAMQNIFGIPQPAWQAGLTKVLQDLGEI